MDDYTLYVASFPKYLLDKSLEHQAGLIFLRQSNIKHGLLENPPFIDDFPSYKSPFIEEVPTFSHVFLLKPFNTCKMIEDFPFLRLNRATMSHPGRRYP